MSTAHRGEAVLFENPYGVVGSLTSGAIDPDRPVLRKLAEPLAQLMDDEPLRVRLAKSGRERVVERYNLRNNVERLAGVFEERVKL